MSHYMTALAMKQKGLKPAAKVVLYWIADHHNGETGQCNPSIKRLAECCEMSRRSVENHIASLEAAGLVDVQQRYRAQGGKTANSYTLRFEGSDAQNLRMGSAKSAHGGCAKSAHDRTLEDTNLGTEQEISPSSVLSECASEEAARSFISYRQKQKGKALSLTAAKRLASQLRRIAESGGDADDALGMAEERGWQSVQADWYFKAKGENHGHGSRSQNTAADATSRAIAFAGRASRAPSEDSF